MPGYCRIAYLLVALLVSANNASADTTLHEIDVDGTPRTFLVYAPPQYDGETPLPVVFAFHGAFEDGEEMQRISGLSEKAAEAGFLVVYPDAAVGFGRDRFWNTGSWKVYSSDNRHELRFVAALLDELPEFYAVDPQRIYATGYSIGGMLCHQLAAEFPDRIAAIAPVEGPIAVPIGNDSQPVPVIMFHGTDDWVIPFEGPVNFIAWLLLGFTSIEDTLAAWCEINDCPLDPAITEYPDLADDGTTVERWEFGPGAEGTDVVLIKIFGGGHVWPGQDPGTWLYGKATFDIHANDVMWEFFERYPLAN